MLTLTKLNYYKNFIFLVTLSSLVSACAFNKTDGAIISVPPASVSDQDREHTALAFISYTGDLLTGSDREVEKILAPCLQKELKRQPLTSNKYQLVWGPTVYKFELGKFDDNMMYVVRSLADPSHLVISIRGTNAPAVLDWLIEDLEVIRTVKWPYQNSNENLKPRISEGAYKGLKILQGLKPAEGIPGSAQAISDFLTNIIKTDKIQSITVTGHSLGGALAPAFALWLEDTRKQWNPEKTVQLSVVALAGPTPGDKDFSSYYDNKLSQHTRRFHNPYDVVPLAWNTQSMQTIANLYKPSGIKTPLTIKLALEASIEITKDKHYTQIVSQAPTLSGNVYSPKSSFIEQVGWQHHCGYSCAMQMQVTLKPVSADCKNFDPAVICTACPK